MYHEDAFFVKIFDRLLEREEVFQNSPGDRNNWTGGIIGKGELKGTKYGISAKCYPSLDIKNLSKDHAMEIYFYDFYNPFKYEFNIPNHIMFQFFDSVIHHDIFRSVVFLQNVLGLSPDGILGPITVKALEDADPSTLSILFLSERLAFMTENLSWKDCSENWSRHISDNLKYAVRDFKEI